MSLALYSAYFFVTRGLGTLTGETPPVDGTPPVDATLAASVIRAALADALASDVAVARLTSHPDVVRVDPNALRLASSQWTGVFGVRDALLTCACLDSGESCDVKTRNNAFSDYIVTRWIFKAVLRLEIRQRPNDRAFPPSFDADGKRALAESLIRTVGAVGLSLKDAPAFLQGAGKWSTLGEARAALLKQVPL